MCDTGGVRQGIEGIGDCIEIITDVKRSVMPIIVLMSSLAELNPNIGAVLTNEDLADIGMFLREEFGKVFKAVDSINGRYMGLNLKKIKTEKTF